MRRPVRSTLVLIALVCALFGHLWMQAGHHSEAAAPGQAHGGEGDTADDQQRHVGVTTLMLVACTAVLAAAVVLPVLRAGVGRRPDGSLGMPAGSTATAAVPRRPPPARSFVGAGVLLRI